MSLILVIHPNGALVVHTCEDPIPLLKTEEDVNLLKETIAQTQGYNSINAIGNELKVLDTNDKFTIIIEDSGPNGFNPTGSLVLHSLHVKCNSMPWIGVSSGYVAITDGRKKLTWPIIEDIVCMAEDLSMKNPSWDNILNL